MLSDVYDNTGVRVIVPSLNAPFGARCFLTGKRRSTKERIYRSLNAPFGARCFLILLLMISKPARKVLMHLLALGAF